MLIRTSQKVLLAHSVFERWAAEHLQRCFPQACAALGPAGVRSAVLGGIRAAEELGLEDDSDRTLSVELAFILGPEFHRDPAQPWVGQVLQEPELSDAHQRIERLHAVAVARMLELATSLPQEGA